jgi:hypothetical protein
MVNKIANFILIISLILLVGCNKSPDLQEDIIIENSINETSEETIELQNQDINVVLQGFKTTFGRDLKINLELETEKYRVYSDPSIQVLEIKDKDDYIVTYGDLFRFVKSEADSILLDFKGEDKDTLENEYPQYVYRYILENEGKVNHLFIKRHVLWAELDRSSFQDHEYYQWTYDYCSSNIVVKIKAKRNFGGMESYSSFEDFISNAESHGEEYTSGLKEGTNLKRPPLIQNFDSLRNSKSCFNPPLGFNNDFENLREDITEEIGVSGLKSPQITEEEIDDFQENSFEGACPPPTEECDQTWWLKTRKEEIDGKEYYVYHCDYFVGDIGKIYEKNRYCLENHEICNDWKDNDQNGLMDCADPNCSNDVYCD